MDLSWSDNSGNETGFEIEGCVETGKGRSKTCDFAPLGSAGADATGWSDPNPEDGRRYRVRAVNEFGASAWSNTAQAGG
ncbi:MAG: fibronectin type III domain-containing protein [Gammaproteobacteria bacterium]